VFGALYVVGSFRVNALTRNDLDAIRTWLLATSRSAAGRAELENGARK
jgi:hypothetical protein